MEDPNAKFARSNVMARQWQADGFAAPIPAPNTTETAWERGLRIAKEMKEKALRRKQIEKDFEEKKMNLSLKELEDEKENDERHLNVERAPRNDFEDDEMIDVAYIERRDRERTEKDHNIDER